MEVKINIAGEDNYTGFCDEEGTKIYLGNKVQFTSTTGAIWNGIVVYEDGVFTISILNAEQVINPKDWKNKYDWIESRWWSSQVGYGEFGTWNVARKSLIDIAGMFKSFEQFKEAQEKCHSKYGSYIYKYLHRPLPCLVV